MSTELLYKLKIPNTLRQLHERVKEKKRPKPNSNLIVATRNFQRLKKEYNNLPKRINLERNLAIALRALHADPVRYGQVLDNNHRVVYQRISTLPRLVPKNNKMMFYQTAFNRLLARNLASTRLRQPFLNASRRLILASGRFAAILNNPAVTNEQISQAGNYTLAHLKINKGRLIRNTYRRQKYAPNTALGRARLEKMFEGSPPRTAPATKKRRRA